MLLWESLNAGLDDKLPANQEKTAVACGTVRLPYDTRCAALTKSGRRCRGKIRAGKDVCIFHDPEVAAKRVAAARKHRHRRLSHLPDGYLRKLSTRAAVGTAMDRLYREVRLQIITPEMGRVLMGILTRLLDSGVVDKGKTSHRPNGRSRADRMRPRLERLLTSAEHTAWQKAVANAPPRRGGTQRARPPIVRAG